MNRSNILEVMARAMCAADGFVWEKQFSHMTSANGDDSPESYLHAAAAALTAYESHLQASGMAVVPREHLEPFAKYYRSRMAVQMRGMDDCIHRIHPGSEHEAEISVTDCGRLAAALLI